MNKLQLPQAKLLWAVSQAYRKRKIDQTQKRLLKERIISDNVEIFQILQKTDNQTQLIDKLVGLVRVPQIPQQVNHQETQVIKVTEQQEASSPWGEFLRRKKINRQHQHKNQAKNLQSLIVTRAQE